LFRVASQIIDFLEERKNKCDYFVTKKSFSHVVFKQAKNILLKKVIFITINKQTQIKFHFSIKSINY
jgi:lysozyme family protein